MICNNIDENFLLTCNILLQDNSIDSVEWFGKKYVKSVVICSIKFDEFLGELINERFKFKG